MNITLEDFRSWLAKKAQTKDDKIDFIMTEMVEHFLCANWGLIPYYRTIRSVFNKDEDDDNDDDDFYGAQNPDTSANNHNKDLDEEKTIQNILDVYKDECIVYKMRGENRILSYIIISDEFAYCEGYFYLKNLELPSKLLGCGVYYEKNHLQWVMKSHSGFTTKYLEIKPLGDIEGNYNDNIKEIDEKIDDILADDKSSIIILHGAPGTGKTSYIRNLIARNNNINFYWLDAGIFNYIDSSEFVRFLTECENGVFILEDSESLLRPRERGGNPSMQSLLAMSDGLLGDSLKIKFICTFNTNLTEIDTAITRKGRMKMRYEFKKLNVNKCKAILRKQGLDENLINDDTALCDVYNILSDNNQVITKKIGF